MTVILKYFKLEEFDSPDLPGSGRYMKEATLRKLDVARGYADCPFRIGSGFRTSEHNRAVRGSPTSSHLFGYAVDIEFYTEKQMVAIIAGCALAGFRRIGSCYARHFVHVDNDPNKPPKYFDYG